MSTKTAELQVPEPRSVALDPEHTAIVVVDVENEFMRPAGRAYLGERAERILAPLAALLAKARAAGAPIVYIHSVRDPDAQVFRVFEVHEHLLRGSWGAEYCEEIAPQPGDPVVDKTSHDCFNHTELETVLARLGVPPCDSTVMVTGVGLGVCVLAAVLGFSVRDYWVAVPMDCVAARTEESELVAYQPFLQRAWGYNIALTRSDLIEFSPGIGVPRAQAAAASVH
jgi:nicotinamidase-related amidase